MPRIILIVHSQLLIVGLDHSLLLDFALLHELLFEVVSLVFSNID